MGSTGVIIDNSFPILVIKFLFLPLRLILRGKSRDFVTKIGKEFSIITPVDPNTSSSNEKFNLLWLSPDEWFLYSNDKIDLKDANFLENRLFNEISKVKLG